MNKLTKFVIFMIFMVSSIVLISCGNNDSHVKAKSDFSFSFTKVQDDVYQDSNGCYWLVYPVAGGYKEYVQIFKQSSSGGGGTKSLPYCE